MVSRQWSAVSDQWSVASSSVRMNSWWQAVRRRWAGEVLRLDELQGIGDHYLERACDPACEDGVPRLLCHRKVAGLVTAALADPRVAVPTQRFKFTSIR